MGDIKAIIGLGNPGEEYALTRHNIGYMVVDMILRKYRGKFERGGGKFLSAHVKIGGNDVILLRSRTYMNDSGLGANAALRAHDLKPSELLVISDDFAIPFGALRIRKTGSDGGHNGLASIIEVLGTKDIARMRIGIGPLPTHASIVDFVLTNFLPDEQKLLPQLLETAQEATTFAVVRGLERAMELFNRSAQLLPVVKP